MINNLLLRKCPLFIYQVTWARTCSHAQSKCLRDLEKEIDFFDTDGGCEQGEQL